MGAPFQYVLLHRQDRPGVYAVQAAHAASEAIRVAPVSKETVVCVLVAESSEELEELSRVLTAAGIHHSLVREDRPPYKDVATALATEPQEKGNVEEVLPPFQAPAMTSCPRSSVKERPREGTVASSSLAVGSTHLSNGAANWIAGRVLTARDALKTMRTDDTLKILYTLARDAYRHGQESSEGTCG